MRTNRASRVRLAVVCTQVHGVCTRCSVQSSIFERDGSHLVHDGSGVEVAPGVRLARHHGPEDNREGKDI